MRACRVRIRRSFAAWTAVVFCAFAAIPIKAYADRSNDVDQELGVETILGQITVTARRREERLLDVPLSVQAFSAVTLNERRIDNVQGLIGIVPNLSVSSNLLSPGKDFLNLVIRGVGAQSAGAPAVGTFVDGVYVPGLSFDVGFMDVERVEVLRGPQGSLFGRNTEGGALNIVLRRPSDETRARIALTYDEFNTIRGQANISGALSDKLFGAAAADLESSDGFLRNREVTTSAGAGQRSFSVPADDYRRFSGRVALRYAPNDQFDMNLSVDGSNRTGLDGLPGIPRGTKEYIVRSDFQIDADYDNYGAALNLDYHHALADLTATTGYRKVKTVLPFDFDGSPEFMGNFHDLRSDQEIISQEFRIAGKYGPRFNWIGGVYGFSERALQDRSFQLPTVEIFPAGIFINAQTQRIKRDGVAVYADATIRPFDKLELNAGLRYSYEKVKSHVDLDFTLPGIITVVDSGSDSISDSQFSPTVSLRYSLADNVTTYVRYAEGYKAGGFPLAPASASTNISFGPESSNNYEVGVKGHLLDGALAFDLAAFRIDISDQQLSTIVFLNGDPNLPVASVGNAGKSRSEGFEAQLIVRPFDGLELAANVGMTDAKYEQYIDTTGTDRSGEPFPFVPKWTGQFSTTYRFPMQDNVDLELYGAYRYVDNVRSGSGVDIDIQFLVPSYEILDIRASVIKGRWRADVFIDNVTDEFAETRVFNSFFFAEPRPFSIVLAPRRVGARFTYAF